MSTPSPGTGRIDLETLLARIEGARTAAGRTEPVRLLAVSKGQPAAAVRELHQAGQRAFGENYLQEAVAKQGELAGLDLEWHFIGHLQSKKSAEVARHFDWLQSLDRIKLVPLLARARPPGREPLKVLLQVNIDAESSKSGCTPDQLPALAAAVAAEPALALRGLMALPEPDAEGGDPRAAFARMRALFESLAREHPGLDTLSMGMSGDFEAAIAEGATLVRVGTALFGPRPG